MKILLGAKDGGPESRVRVWGIESKRWGSALLLKFERGSREAYHTHAFNSVSWVLSGGLLEKFVFGAKPIKYLPSLRPVRTYRTTFHMVEGIAATTWVLSFRGRWLNRWREYLPKTRSAIVLTHGRKEISHDVGV